MRNRTLRGRQDAARQSAAVATVVASFRRQRRVLELLVELKDWKKGEEAARELCGLLSPSPAGAGSVMMGKGTCSAPIPEGAVAVLNSDSNVIFLDKDAQVISAFTWAGSWRNWYAQKFTPVERDLDWYWFRPLAAQLRLDRQEVALFGRSA